MNKQPKTPNQMIIADDILRYKKNKLAQTFALLGLVFNCLYFLLLYAMPKTEFRTITIGFSVVLTLITLLAIFLSSEGVKGYNKKYSIVLLVVAAFQILRIFYYPLKGLQNNWFVSLDSLHLIGYFGAYPQTSTPFFVILVIYLVASAACLIASAVWGWIVAVRLEKFQKRVDNGEIDIQKVIKEMDEEDEQAKKAEVKAAQEPVVSEEVQ